MISKIGKLLPLVKNHGILRILLKIKMLKNILNHQIGALGRLCSADILSDGKTCDRIFRFHTFYVSHTLTCKPTPFENFSNCFGSVYGQGDFNECSFEKMIKYVFPEYHFFCSFEKMIKYVFPEYHFFDFVNLRVYSSISRQFFLFTSPENIENL